jgi:hypothetical protein
MNIDVLGPSITAAAIKDQQDYDALGLPEIPDSHSGIAQKLPTPIRILYGLNGMTEAFPTLALVAMVNDRIEIPISFVPAYFAVSFLPYSLKPLYAIAAANVAKNQKTKNVVDCPLYMFWTFIAGNGFLAKGADCNLLFGRFSQRCICIGR